MTVQQPATRVVEHADDVTAITCIHQDCIPYVAQSSILINLVKVVSVQVDAVWKRCVVYKRDPDGLTIVIKAKSTPPGPNSTKASIQKMFISEVIKKARTRRAF